MQQYIVQTRRHYRTSIERQCCERLSHPTFEGWLSLFITPTQPSRVTTNSFRSKRYTPRLRERKVASSHVASHLLVEDIAPQHQSRSLMSKFCYHSCGQKLTNLCINIRNFAVAGSCVIAEGRDGLAIAAASCNSFFRCQQMLYCLAVSDSVHCLVL